MVLIGSIFDCQSKGLGSNPGRRSNIMSESLQKEFDILVENWKKETRFHSSLSKIYNNENYMKIVDMGVEAIPLIMDHMKEYPDFGFWIEAVCKITEREVFIPYEMYGIIPCLNEQCCEHCLFFMLEKEKVDKSDF